MIKQFYTAILVFLVSCGVWNENKQRAPLDADSVPNTTVQEKGATPADIVITFLWRANKYDASARDSVNAIFIDEPYLGRISEPERAAVGYIATFVGNECNWDGKYKEDRSNLKCKILTALNLGYQCSDTHLGFLRQWFKNDDKVLAELNPANCPTIPEGSTIQETFDQITLTKNENTISVFCKVRAINVREGKTSTRTQTALFELNGDNIKLISQEKSPAISGN